MANILTKSNQVSRNEQQALLIKIIWFRFHEIRSIIDDRSCIMYEMPLDRISDSFLSFNNNRSKYSHWRLVYWFHSEHFIDQHYIISINQTHQYKSIKLNLHVLYTLEFTSYFTNLLVLITITYLHTIDYNCTKIFHICIWFDLCFLFFFVQLFVVSMILPLFNIMVEHIYFC